MRKYTTCLIVLTLFVSALLANPAFAKDISNNPLNAPLSHFTIQGIHIGTRFGAIKLSDGYKYSVRKRDLSRVKIYTHRFNRFTKSNAGGLEGLFAKTGDAVNITTIGAAEADVKDSIVSTVSFSQKIDKPFKCGAITKKVTAKYGSNYKQVGNNRHSLNWLWKDLNKPKLNLHYSCTEGSKTWTRFSLNLTDKNYETALLEMFSEIHKQQHSGGDIDINL